MTAIVSSNTLGLDLGSLSSLGTAGQFGNAALGQSRERSYVNVATGNLVLQETDTALMGVGSNAATQRTYNSQGQFDFDNADGWVGAPYKSVVLQPDGSLLRTDSDGSTNRFAWDADASAFVAVLSAGQALDQITVNGAGNYLFTDGTTGRVEEFQGAGGGLILSSTDTSGNRLDFTYDTQDLLVRVDNGDGESVQYSYSGRNLAQVSTQLQGGQVVSDVSYTYDSANRLRTVSVTLNQSGNLPAGAESGATYTTTYTYSGTGTRVASVTQGDGTRQSFTYVSSGGVFKVATVTDGLGRITRFGYNNNTRTTTVTDALGVASTFRYDSAGQLSEVRTAVTAANPTGATRLVYSYNGLGDVASVTDGLDHTVNFEYDSRGNQTGQTDALGNTLTRTFNRQNQLLTETVFPQADRRLTTRYIYDEARLNRLRFSVSAQGNVTEYRYNTAGLRTASIRYSAGTYPLDGLATDEVPTETQFQDWALLQDQTQAERADSAYDHRGQLQSVTTYAQLDAGGNGVGAASVSLYVYDQKGELLQTVTPDGAGISQQVYDGLGRVVSSSSRSADGTINITTLTQYDDAHAKTTVRLANGLATVSAYDRAGRVITVTQNAGGPVLGTTLYTYDALGNVAMTVDPTGQRNWMLYDNAGRKVADIGADGQLTEYVYDQDNRHTETIAYANKVDTSLLVNGAGQPLTVWNANPARAPAGVTPVTLDDLRQASYADQTSWNFYDDADRLCFQVDALGRVTQTQYDGASRVTSVTRLATSVDTSRLGDGRGLEMVLGGYVTTTELGVSYPGDLWMGPNTPRILTATVVGGASPPDGTVSFYASGRLLGSAELSDGVAVLTVSNLPIGLDVVTAVYAGSAGLLGSTSDGWDEYVEPGADTVTVLTASSASASASATVTLTATVTGDNAGGMVTFYSGSRAIGNAALMNGVATIDVNNLPRGNNILTAVYAGDPVNASSTSAAITEIVTAAPSSTVVTVTTLLASNKASNPGDPITLTAQVSGALPGGKVNFYDNGVLLGSATLASGLAVLTVTGLALGTARFTARYLGDAVNIASSSAAFTAVVLVPATVAVAASAPGAALGEPLTFTASVSGTNPGGVVNFFCGDVLLGSAAVSGGQASLTVASLPLGDVTVTAVYSGDAVNAAAASGAFAVTMSPAPTTVALATSAAATAYSVNLTLTATVGGTGSPSGTVTFYNGSTVLGTASVVAGIAHLTVSNLPVGTASLRAVFEGDAGNLASTSAAVDQVVTTADVTRTVLSASAASATYGSAITLTAQVNGAGTVGGSVTFYNGATVLGTTAISDGTASLIVSNLPVGAGSLSAVYGGDVDHSASTSAIVSPAVAAAATTLQLASSAPSSAYGAAVVLTATLGAGVGPAGTVTFFNGRTALGTATLVNGQAVLSLDTLPVGNLSLSAAYSGDAGNLTSVATLDQTVVAATTTTTLSTSQASAAQGSAVILTARVTSSTTSRPAGIVTFYSGNTALGTATVFNGMAALTVSGLPAGASVLSASYAGDARNGASASAGVAETISAAPLASATTLTTSATTVTQGMAVTFTATVAGTSPGGVVTFVNGMTVLGTATVDGSGVATLTTDIRTLGNASIGATYGGDSANASSASARVAVRVNAGVLPPAPPIPPATTTALTASLPGAVRGDPVTLFVRVDRTTSGPVPQGTVSFFSGTTLIGSAVLASGQASLTLRNLPVGADQVRAVYSGDTASATSTSAILTETISLSSSTVALTLSANTVVQGASLLLTAQVTGHVAPGGTVTFYSGATVLATVGVANGLASRSVTTLPVGAASITARYNGDGNNATSTSATASVNVTPAPVTSTVTLTSSVAFAPLGEPVVLTASVTGAAPAGTVTFFNNSTLLGSATVVNGQAVLAVGSLPRGNANLRAVYSGDAGNSASTSALLAELVVAASTVTTLTTSSAVSGYGSALTLQAAVSGTGSPAGTVRFYNGATLLGSVALSNGAASLTLSTLPIGSDALTAVYLGNNGNVTSTSAVLSETVTVAPTALAVTSGASIAQNGVLTVQVTGSTPTGFVTFLEGQTVVGVAAVLNGVATLNGTTLAPGAHQLSVTYGGNARNAASVLSFTQEVVAAECVVTLSSTSSYVAQNSPLVLSVKVTGSDPTGTVTFYNGDAAIGTATLSNGIGAITISTLDDGVAAFRAVYSGDANNAGGASAVFNELVVRAPVNVILSLAEFPLGKQGTPMVLKAQVSGDRPVGSVAFVSGTTTLGTASVVNGVATLVIDDVSLPAGVNSVIAVFMGDNDNAVTLSDQITFNVAPGVADLLVAKSDDDRSATLINDADGRVRASIDAAGYVTEMRYNAAGRLAQTLRYANLNPLLATPDGIAAMAADARRSGTLANIIPEASSADITTWLYYDARGQKTGEVDGEGFLTEYVHDGNGNLTQQIRYANAVTAALPGETLAQIRPTPSPLDSVVSSSWDALNRLATQTNAEGTVTRYTYDNVGRVVSSDLAWNTADLQTQSVRYDVQGNLVAELSAEGAAHLTGGQSQAAIDGVWAQYAVTHTYDAAGRRTSSTDALGHRTVFLYDEAGRLRYTVNALGEVREQRYGDLGRLENVVTYDTRLGAGDVAALQGGVLSSTPATAQAALLLEALDDGVGDSFTSYFYDNAGQLTEMDDAESGYSLFEYDAFGELTQTQRNTGPADRIDTSSYDRRGLKVESVADSWGEAVITDAVYDAFGRMVSTTDGNGNLHQQEFDRLGRVVLTIDPTNAQRGTSYDAFGRVLSQTDALGHATQYAYDRAARSATVTTPEGVTLTTVHTRRGQTANVTDGNGNTTSYSYDHDGNLKRTDTPLTASTADYDTAGRLIRTTDANGVPVEYTYDAANRLLTRTLDPAGLALASSYGYDAKGQRVTATDANGVVTETGYDLNGRVLTQTVDPTGLNLTTSYEYNAIGDVLTVTSPGGTVTSYVYDGLGRRIEEHLDPDGMDLVCRYEYDYDSNLIRKTDANGNQTVFAYDASDRLVFTVDGAGGVRENSYDIQGRLARTTAYATPVDLPRWLPSADEIQALVQASPQDVVHDRVLDDDGRLRFMVDGEGGVTESVYDGNGNVVRQVAYAQKIDRAGWAHGTDPAVTASAGDRELRTVYDSLNRAEWTVDGAGSVTHTVYDGNGNVTQHTVYAAKVDLLAWNPSAPAAAADPAHDLVTRTVFDSANRAVYVVDGTGAVIAQKYDGNGNAMARTAYATRLPAGTPATGPSLDLAVQSIADPAHDARIRRVFDAANRLDWSVDGAGAVTGQSYDGNGNLVRQVAYATAISADASPDSVVSSDADRTILMAYDAVNQKTWQVDALGSATAFTYDAVGNLLTRTSYANRLEAPQAGSDPAAVPWQVAGLESSNDDRTIRAVYDGANRQVLSVDAGGAATQTIYDGVGNATATIAYAETSWGGEVPESSKPDRRTLRAFDGAGHQVYSVNALGYVTQTQYDGTGQVIASTLHGTSISGKAPPALTWGRRDQIEARLQTSSEDRTDTFTYDGGGNLIGSTDAMGNTESYVRDGLGNKTSFTNKNGATWTYGYDAAGRLLTETSPQVAIGEGDVETAIVTRLEYDALGNLLSRTEAFGIAGQQRTTSYDYDAMGRQVRTTFPPVDVYNAAADNLAANGANGVAARTESSAVTLSTEVAYDVFGQAISNRDVADNYSYKAYDKLGRVTAEIDALRYVTGYGRNTFGDAVTLTRYEQPVILPTSGATGDQVSEALAGLGGASRVITTDYDNLGRAVRVTEPETWVNDGWQSSGYWWDQGQASQGRYAAKVTETSYNAFGNVVETGIRVNSEQLAATTHYYYDRMGQLVGTMDPLGYLTTQQFDGAGNVTSRTEYANSFADVSGPLPLGTVDSSAGQVFDATAGLLASSTNPSGPWQYGWKWSHGDPSLNLYDTDIANLDHSGSTPDWAPSWAVGGDGQAIPDVSAAGDGTLVARPGSNMEVSVVRWTAPAAGTYTIDFFNIQVREGGNSEQHVDVVRAGGIDWSWRDWPYWSEQGSFHATVTLQAGDCVDFEIGDADDGYVNDATWFNASVTEGEVPDTSSVNASPDDRKTDYQYDLLNRLVSETRLNVEHSHGSNGSVVNDRGNYYNDYQPPAEDYYGNGYGEHDLDITTRYEYDAVGNLLATTDALGNRTSSDYDSLGRVTRVTSPRTEVLLQLAGGSEMSVMARPEVEFHRDAYGNVVAKVEKDWSAPWANYESHDRVTRTEYDSHGHATRVTDAGGYEHFMSYDRQGQLAKQWQGVTGNSGEGTHTLYTYFAYDALGRQTDIVTPGTNSVVAGGQVTTIDQASAGMVHTQSVYNAYGELIQRGTYKDNAVALQEWFQYDAAGRLVRTNSGDGVTRVMLYNVQGFQTVQLSSAGGESGANLDLVASVEAADQLTEGVRRTDIRLDALGHALEQHLPERVDIYESQTRPLIVQTFDRWGNVVTQSDPRDYYSGDPTQFRYNANNQVVQQIQPYYWSNGYETGNWGPIVPATYIRHDALGRQVAVIDANTNLNGEVLDAAGHVLTDMHADGGSVRHGYNMFGEQVQLVDAEGNSTNYTRDALGRVTKIEGDTVSIATADAAFNVSTRTAALATTFTYDSAGRKLTETNAAGETNRLSYDLRGNVIASVQPMGQVTRAAFDAFGHQVGSQDPDGALATWSYDSFGQLQSYQDIGGARHFMFYDVARQLDRQTSTREQYIQYGYDGAGQLISIDDFGTGIGRSTQYSYDAAGHRVRERTVQGDIVYQDNQLNYDRLGRLQSIQALDNFYISFEYDAAGNKIHQHVDGQGLARSIEGSEQVLTGSDEGGAPVYTSNRTFTTVYDATSQDMWFSYDSMNRQVLVDGLHYGDVSLNNINSAQGHLLTYDHNGNRTSDTQYGQQVTTQQLQSLDESGNVIVTSGYASRNGPITEYYAYDRMNRLASVSTGGFDANLNPLNPSQAIMLDVRTYDAAGRLVRNGPAGTPAGTLPSAYTDLLNTGGNSDANGAISRVNRYDANGRLMAQHVTKPDGSFSYDIIYAGTVTSEIQVESGQDENGNPLYTTQSITQTGPGYDAAGNILGYRMTDGDGVTSSYNMTLARFEGYKEATVSGFRSDNTGEVRTTTNSYDVNGQLVGITDNSGSNDAARQFVNDANGMVLQKTQQGNVFKQLVVDGQVYASYGMAENPQHPGEYTNQTTFNPNFQPITNGYPSAATGTYTVRSGDTLETIAQAAYGDSQLWYLIADANALRGNADLRVGQTLNIPTKVGSIHNTGSTYKPYNPSDVIGSTTPNLPVPQSDDGGCGGLGQIIMIVVAVVVTIYTAGAASGFVGGFMETMAAGSAALAGGSVTAAVIGGAVGSIASQAVGNAIGAVDGFSWKAVALSAISAGVGAGLGSAGVLSGTGFGTTVMRAATSSALTQGIAVATGLQEHFSWRSVAASAVSAGVGYGVSEALGITVDGAKTDAFKDAGFGEKLLKSSLTGFAAGATAAVMRGGRVSVTQVATDAFGNALGSSLSDEFSQPSQQTGKLGEIVSSQGRFTAIPDGQGFQQAVMWSSDPNPGPQTLQLTQEDIIKGPQYQQLSQDANPGNAAAKDELIGLTAAQRQAMVMGNGPLTPEAAAQITGPRDGLATASSPPGDIAGDPNASFRLSERGYRQAADAGGGDSAAGDLGVDSPDAARESAKFARQAAAARQVNVFAEDYLVVMPGTKVQGAGNKELVSAMTVLQGERDAGTGKWSINATPDQIDQHLQAIATARGVPLENIREDFDKFQRLAQARESAAIDKPDFQPGPFVEGAKGETRVPMLSMSETNGLPNNSVHMGSENQLRFGRMVGDTLGIDPVFGALLSPTGGIAGAGNKEVSDTMYVVGGGKDVVINHGIAHDAGGYLYKYHDQGPGYQYVPNVPFHILDRGNPLAGQVDGLYFFGNVKRYGSGQAPKADPGY